MWNLLVNVASVAAGIVLAVSYVPQIVNLYKTKQTEGISLSFWVILNLSLAMLFILAVDSYLKANTLGLLVTQGLNLVLALVVMGQVIYYRKK